MSAAEPGKLDVVIIGAGASGLAALEQLDRAGARVLCLEARDRIGGRVYSVHDPLCPMAVELGAEFVHGRPPEIWDVIRAQGLMAYEVAPSAVHVRGGKVRRGVNGWELIDEVMTDMQESANVGPDQSFSEFLKGTKHSDDAKQLASSYVEGFNAARKELISVASLAKDGAAADQIDGDRSFRFVKGYDSLLLQMISRLSDVATNLRLNSEIEQVQWDANGATVRFRSPLTGQAESVQTRRVILTVALGVLQCGGIAFDPEPVEVLRAARALKFGQVVRVTLRFREAFWEERDELVDAAFLLSDERFFPTWWTPLPMRASVITGWSAGPHCDELLGKQKAEIIKHALADLSRISGVAPAKLSNLLEAAYFHDWHADRFARGAYSYVPVGALGAREELATPVGDTLYFAGEATNLDGHSATVHGAIASGRRAARQIIEGG